MLTRQFPIVILLVFNLLFAKEIQGQASKVVIVNLDSLRNQSVIAEWEKALWEEAGWQEEGEMLVDTLQQKYLRLQRIIERGCMTPEAIDKILTELEKDTEVIHELERKLEAAKRIFLVEIDNFIRQQFMLLMPKAKSNLDAAFLSTSSPVFMEEAWSDKLVDATPWFASEFKDNSRILKDWLAFRMHMIETVEKGNW